MTKIQAATDTVKELACWYAGLLLITASVYAIAESTSFGDALYWAATTATSTGYGDISPKTWAGKVDAVILMHLSIFVIAPMVIVRLIDRLTVNRDVFSHEEQVAMMAEIKAIRSALDADTDMAAMYVDLNMISTRLEEDMRRYVYDKDAARRISCLDSYRERRGLGLWQDR